MRPLFFRAHVPHSARCARNRYLYVAERRNTRVDEADCSFHRSAHLPCSLETTCDVFEVPSREISCYTHITTHHCSQYYLQILRRLTVLIWEAALPPCICAILTVVTYLTLVCLQLVTWGLRHLLTAPTGQRELLGPHVSGHPREALRHFVICDSVSDFLVLLSVRALMSVRSTAVSNGRAELQDGPAPGFSTNRISNLAWNLSTPIRVEVRALFLFSLPSLSLSTD